MSIARLEKSAWRPYFDNVSKMLSGKLAEIEVASLNIGDQLEAEWLPLLGIVYDPRDDMVEVVLEGLDHMISHPQEVYVDQEGIELSSMEVIDADGVRQIVKLRDPLMLPRPQ